MKSINFDEDVALLSYVLVANKLPDLHEGHCQTNADQVEIAIYGNS